MVVIPIACIMMGCLTDLPVHIDGNGFEFNEEFYVVPKRCSIGGRWQPCPKYKEKS